MREREQYNLAITVAETMYNLWELKYQQEEPDVNAMMCRFKDLSAYSLTYAEILNQREGVELLALGMFFGATSNPQFHKNQERLKRLSDEAIAYQGQPEIIAQEVARRKKAPDKKQDDNTTSPQLPLFRLD